jgi:hypothetical protein
MDFAYNSAQIMNSDITESIFFNKRIFKKGTNFKIPFNCKLTSIEMSVPDELES